MTNTPLRIYFVAALLLALGANGAHAADQPLSVVDYMKAVGTDSTFANRKQIYVARWPGESYTGKAAQNLKLLNHLLALAAQVRIPNPTSDVEKCKEFYQHPLVSKFLTEDFKENAVAACIVTGTKTPQNIIRKELQKAYGTAKPADGKTFTDAEHKAIHDKAYKAAGCKEDSAHIVGWWIVNRQALDAEMVKFAIEHFGQCTVPEEQ